MWPVARGVQRLGGDGGQHLGTGQVGHTALATQSKPHLVTLKREHLRIRIRLLEARNNLR